MKRIVLLFLPIGDKRSKARNRSQLEQIAGVGSKRRQAQLLHFGGQAELAKASVVEIARVKGISKYGSCKNL